MMAKAIGSIMTLVAVFEIGVDYGSKMLDGYLIAVLVVGGIITGVLAEWASRRWS